MIIERNVHLMYIYNTTKLLNLRVETSRAVLSYYDTEMMRNHVKYIEWNYITHKFTNFCIGAKTILSFFQCILIQVLLMI